MRTPPADLGRLSRRPSPPAVRGFRRSRNAVAGTALLTVLVLVAILSPLITPYPPTKPHPTTALEPPGHGHWMGTDEIGRDILSRVLAGARISLGVGVAASAITLVVGVAFGLIAGYRGGWADAVVMRAVDVLLAMPTLLFALAIVAAMGPSLLNVTLAVGVAGIPRFTRLMRGVVLSAKQNVYVEAAHAVGCGGVRIAVRHILPNVYGPALVLATLNVGVAILTGASLSFLGMGAQPPTPEWGLILARGRDYLRTAWWISTFPGIAIAVTVLAVNLFGDGLYDSLDPQRRL